MTADSPEVVKYEWTADVALSGEPIPVTNIIASQDRDRNVFCEAVLETYYLDDSLFAALDPRAGARVNWRVEQQNESGTQISEMPFSLTFPGQEASMYVREVSRDPLNNTGRIRLAGGESMLMDKIRNAGTTLPIPGPPTTVAALVGWSIGDVIGSYTISNAAITISTALPAGNRRLMFPEETHMDLLKPELDAIDCRLFDFWGIQWFTRVRSAASGTMELATYEGFGGADPIVFEYTERMSRDGDWADGVLVKYDTTSTGGAVTYQASGLGVNTKGVNISFDRVAPGSNSANVIVERTKTRGYDLEVTARIRFDLDAYYALEVYHPAGSIEARVRSIEWNIGEGVMRIRAQAGEPEE